MRHLDSTARLAHIAGIIIILISGYMTSLPDSKAILSRRAERPPPDLTLRCFLCQAPATRYVQYSGKQDIPFCATCTPPPSIPSKRLSKSSDRNDDVILLAVWSAIHAGGLICLALLTGAVWHDEPLLRWRGDLPKLAILAVIGAIVNIIIQLFRVS